MFDTQQNEEENEAADNVKHGSTLPRTPGALPKR